MSRSDQILTTSYLVKTNRSDAAPPYLTAHDPCLFALPSEVVDPSQKQPGLADRGSILSG
jgi:hypothetical protein